MYQFFWGFLGGVGFLTLTGNYRAGVGYGIVGVVRYGIKFFTLSKKSDNDSHKNDATHTLFPDFGFKSVLKFFHKPFLFLLGILIARTALWIFDARGVPQTIHQGATIQGTIIGARSSGVYEIAIQGDTYLLNYPDYLPTPTLDTTVYGIVSQLNPAESIEFSRALDQWDRHSLVTGEFVYTRWMYMKGYLGSVNLRSIKTTPPKTTATIKNSSFITTTRGFRNTLSNRITEVFGKTKEGGLLQGMLVGGRQGMSDEQYQSFIDSGLVHIVAVSGTHITLLAIGLRWVLFFVPITLRRVLIGCGIVCYLAVCGFTSSTMRAVGMAIVNLLVIFRGVKLSFKRLLIYVITGLLLYNPYFLLFDLGFPLSICAVIGLRIGGKLTYEYPKIFKQYLLPPVFAFLGIFPIIILFTGTINLVSFLTSILLGPFLSIILLVSILALIISVSRLTSIASVLLDSIYKLAAYGQEFGVYLVVHDTLWSIGIVVSCFVAVAIVCNILRLQPAKLL